MEQVEQEQSYCVCLSCFLSLGKATDDWTGHQYNKMELGRIIS